MGQPVDLIARVAAGAHGKIDGAAFHIAGPGIAPGTSLGASPEGAGTYRATFTFLEGGRFEVSFSARADGAPLRSARMLVVGAGGPLPLPARTAAPATSPPPVGTEGTKWL